MIAPSGLTESAPSEGAPGRQTPWIKLAAKTFAGITLPHLVTIAIVVPVLMGFRWAGLIADVPVWTVAAIILVGTVVLAVMEAAWPAQSGALALNANLGATLAVITAVIYVIGWGPTLAVGLVFGAGNAQWLYGSSATYPAVVWSVALIGAGQGAIALGWVHSLVAQPLVHGLAGLAALGVVLTVELLGRSVRASETSAQRLRGEQRRFEALVRHAADMILVSDEVGNLEYVSPSVRRLLGYDPEHVSSIAGADLMHPDDVTKAGMSVGSLATTGATAEFELRLRHHDGSWRWFESTVSNLSDDPDIGGIVANLHDVTDRKRNEEALADAEERFRSAFEQAPIGMAMVDLSYEIRRVNSALADIVGIPSSDLLGTSIWDLMHPEDREAIQDSGDQSLISGDRDSMQTEHRLLHADGHIVWARVTASCVRDGRGNPLYFLAQCEDVTEQREMRESLAHAAIHDPLTDLPNRVLFMDRLEVALHRCERAGTRVCVFFLDLDRFKLINDSLGHACGDQVLCRVADRLRETIRASDTLARLSGDEFAILCEDVDHERDAVDLGQRLVDAIASPFATDQGEVFVTVSIGVALSEQVRPSAARLLRRADTAMYKAKDQGRSRLEVYRDEDGDNAIGRLRTGNDLHRALQSDELELHYQPFVTLEDAAMVGAEALVRWRHPSRGMLLPADFVPLAEETGMIVSLGAWVFREACLQNVRWRQRRRVAGQATGRINIAVNVSTIQLNETSFVSNVAEILEDTGVNPDSMWLEITESSLVRDAERTIAILKALRDLGLHLSVDDFGTGYSSLSYLRRFPVETLKIDHSFTSGLGRDPEDTAIVEAVLGLAGSLGLAAIAEGVERADQVTTLRSMGCLLAQGYYFGVPMSASALDPFPLDDLSSWVSEPRASSAS